MSLSRILIILAFALVWGGIAFAQMPIKLMIEHWGAPVGVNINNPSGTLWDGQAEVSLIGEKEAPINTAVNWSWCPSWGRGILSICFEIENRAISGHGFLYRTLFGGKAGMENSFFQVKLGKDTNRLLDAPVDVLGTGNVQIENVLFDTETKLPEVIYASGKLMRVSTQDVKLGDYLWRMHTKPEEQLIEAKISGGADAFQVRAQARVLLNELTYQYSAELNSEHKTVQNIVSTFAKSKGKGVYVAEGNGSLQSLLETQ